MFFLRLNFYAEILGHQELSGSGQKLFESSKRLYQKFLDVWNL